MPARTATSVEVRSPEWFGSWFDSPHYHRLYAHRDDGEASAFVDRLVDRLAPPPAAAVLDLGCGSGRHATHLASRGFDVTGLDLSRESLRRARARRGPRVRFRRRDMRRPFGVERFDCVLNLFTSFGYFEEPADHLTVVRNVTRALRPGGRLVLDYLNVPHAIARLVPDEVARRGPVVYRISRWSDAAAIFKRITIDDPSAPGPLQFVERVARLTLSDFRFLFTLSGLTLEATYGDYGLGRFDSSRSPRLILIARKTDGDAPGAIAARASAGCG